MTRDQYALFISVAKNTTGGEYAAGYHEGLMRHFHGGGIDKASHALHMEHPGERGEGYRDGFAGKPPRGLHGNTGNQNAKKEQQSDAQIFIRCPSDLKSLYVIHAQKQGKKLSEWIIETLNKEISR